MTAKRRIYERAIEWIALNDNPADDVSSEALQSYLTVLLVADTFGREPDEVAFHVLDCRAAHHAGLEWRK